MTRETIEIKNKQSPFLVENPSNITITSTCPERCFSVVVKASKIHSCIESWVPSGKLFHHFVESL